MLGKRGTSWLFYQYSFSCVEITKYWKVFPMFAQQLLYWKKFDLAPFQLKMGFPSVASCAYGALRALVFAAKRVPLKLPLPPLLLEMFTLYSSTVSPLRRGVFFFDQSFLHVYLQRHTINGRLAISREPGTIRQDAADRQLAF